MSNTTETASPEPAVKVRLARTAGGRSEATATATLGTVVVSYKAIGLASCVKSARALRTEAVDKAVETLRWLL